MRPTVATVLSVCIIGLCGSDDTQAADTAAIDTASQPADTLPTIVVTAQKREQNVQDVGASITAFDENTISEMGLKDAADISYQVPGLEHPTYSPTVTIFNLRGVGNNSFADHEEAPIAVYNDGVYVASMGAIAGSNYDLAGIEVDRGPQGTLFGRNATGGLIQYRSKLPADTADGYVDATIGSFAEKDIQGAIGGPLTDHLDGRIAFDIATHNGIITNRLGPDTEDQQQYSFRAQLLWKVSDAGQVLIKLHETRNDHEYATEYTWRGGYPGAHGLGAYLPANLNYFGTCNGCDLSGYRNPSSDVFNQAYYFPGNFNRTLMGASATVTWKFDAFTLTSISDYTYMLKDYSEDSTAGPSFLITYDTTQDYHQYSEELRLNGNVGPFRWAAGAYFLDMSSNNSVGIFLPGPLGGAGIDNYGTPTKSYAPFGQVEWDFTPRMTLIAGLRYSRDDKSLNIRLYNGSDPPYALSYSIDPSTDPAVAKKTFSNEAGKVELDYRISDASLAYASVSRGTKSGGFNVIYAPPTNANSIPYGQEALMDYDLGSKYTFWHGAAHLNTSVFYYDYKGQQVFQVNPVNAVTTIVNRDSELYGGELEFAARPVRGLDVQLGVAGLHTFVKGISLPDGTLVDRVLPNAPKLTTTALVRYEWQALFGKLAASADLKWTGSQYFYIYNGPTDYNPSYAVTNLRLNYSTVDDRWSVGAFLKNAFNKEYRVYSQDISGVGYIQEVYGPPRWWGVDFSYHWH